MGRSATTRKPSRSTRPSRRRTTTGALPSFRRETSREPSATTIRPWRSTPDSPKPGTTGALPAIGKARWTRPSRTTARPSASIHVRRRPSRAADWPGRARPTPQERSPISTRRSRPPRRTGRNALPWRPSWPSFSEPARESRFIAARDSLPAFQSSREGLRTPRFPLNARLHRSGTRRTRDRSKSRAPMCRCLKPPPSEGRRGPRCT